jgi:hypothetical protein
MNRPSRQSTALAGMRSSPSAYVLSTRSLSLWLYSPLLDLGSFFNFLILYTVGRTPLTGDQPVARPLPSTNTKQTQTDIHTLRWVRTHDPSVRVGEDISYPRPRGHCDYYFFKFSSYFYKIASPSLN